MLNQNEQQIDSAINLDAETAAPEIFPQHDIPKLMMYNAMAPCEYYI
jgi:hypothetical protein